MQKETPHPSRRAYVFTATLSGHHAPACRSKTFADTAGIRGAVLRQDLP